MTPPPRSRSRAVRWISASLVLAGLLAAGAALAGPPLAREVARRTLAVEVLDVRAAPERASGFAGRVADAVRKGAAAASGGVLFARLRVSHSLPFAVRVAGARYSVRSGERHLGEGEWRPPEPVAFPAGQPTEIVAPLDTRGAAAARATLDMLRGRDLRLTAEGELRLVILAGSLSVPFTVDRMSR